MIEDSVDGKLLDELGTLPENKRHKMVKKIKRMAEIWEQEDSINIERPVYLITWSPNPDEEPDANFELQHRYNINLLRDYLSACACGVFCVESTQMGNPHYHGWYQVRDSVEQVRIAIVKTLQRFGLVKITRVKKKGCIRKGVWDEYHNSLYYYKKDLLSASMLIEPNPITVNTPKDDYNWLTSSFFTKSISKKQQKLAADSISERQLMLEFYSDKERL